MTQFWLWLLLAYILVRLGVRTTTQPHPTTDDRPLVEAAQAGDLDAFNQLVGRYQRLAYNVAYRIMGAADAAADATQEAFLAAYRKLDTYQPGTSFKAWLLRIVTNKCYDALRAHKRRPTASLDALLLDPDKPDRPFEQVAPERPDEAVEQQELHDLLQALLLTLPPDQRAVLVLADIQGYKYHEIAEILGIEIGTVKSRLFRARRKMRDALREHEELLPPAYRFQNRP
ncbi:MAG: sigma-70 family RNA polymerase sigma factor [Ardenticatenia bacterium]|nr:MAG: sigma-70 family RNA polymerase sigma factor [Ardenticatenia bacterium]